MISCSGFTAYKADTGIDNEELLTWTFSPSGRIEKVTAKVLYFGLTMSLTAHLLAEGNR